MLQDSLKIYLVNQENSIYNKGFSFAQEHYNKTWQTSYLNNDYDYGVVIFWQDNLVGNINIQLKQTNKLLKSEKLFYQQHWQSYFQANILQIAEMSAFTVSKKMPMFLRQGTIIALSLGLITLLNILGTNFVTTIQSPGFYAIFNQTLNLPFFENKKITHCQAKLTNSYNWYSKNSPTLYYLNLADLETLKTYNSFLSYLNYFGISVNFIPTFRLTNSIEHTYANFRQYVLQLDNSRVVA